MVFLHTPPQKSQSIRIFKRQKRPHLVEFQARTQLNFAPPMAVLVANFASQKFAPVPPFGRSRVERMFRRSEEKEPKQKPEAIASGFVLAPPAGLEPATPCINKFDALRQIEEFFLLAPRAFCRQKRKTSPSAALRAADSDS